MIDLFVIFVISSNFLTGPQIEHWAGDPGAFTTLKTCEAEMQRRINLESESDEEFKSAYDNKAIVFQCVRVSNIDLGWARKYPYPGDLEPAEQLESESAK